MINQRALSAVGFILLGVLCLFQQPAIGDSEIEEAQRLAANGGFIATASGATIAGYRSEDLFVPASTIKIATSLVALDLLGADYRFTTEFYLKSDNRLCIKGYGDPSLTSEAIREIAEALKARGITTISELILDDSYFALDRAADGNNNSANPYDAPNGALAVNFNSVSLIKHEGGKIASGENQTPYLPLMATLGAQLKPGRYRINVASAISPPRKGQLRLAAELFTAIFRDAGIKISGGFYAGKASPDDPLIFRYQGRWTVAEMIRNCLDHSNNFMANQLFLASGTARFGAPATWQKGRQAIAEILAERLGAIARSAIILEGSGLSRETRVSPVFMIELLTAFRPYADLLPIKKGVPLKSGTMEGVYAFAGYLPAPGQLDPFVILLNQPHNERRPLLALLKTLHQGHTAAPSDPQAAQTGSHENPAPDQSTARLNR